MDIIEYVEKIDTMFNNVTKDYKYIYDNIHNYLNDGKVSYNQIMDFEVSLEDLSIQLNSLVFLFKQIQIDSLVLLFNKKSNENNKKNSDTNESIENTINFKESKVDKLDIMIEKTIFQYIPLLFIYFMIFDKESILYIKDFIENKYDNKYENKYTNNTYDNINKNKNSEFQFIIEPIDD
jgi:hypothetical protein